MQETFENEANIKVVMKMLTLALVEIRAADSLKTCQALADSFHNVPGMVSHGRSGLDVVEEIFLKAERNGTLAYLKSLLQMCKKGVAGSTL